MELPPNASDAQLTEFNQKQEFVRDAMPDNWFAYAEELADAAEALWSNHDDSIQLSIISAGKGRTTLEKTTDRAPSYILLAGLALENAIKAMLVASSPELVNTGKLASEITTHNLSALAARMVGFTLTADEKHVMQICQDAIPYWGRYPVPLRYNNLLPTEAATPLFRKNFRALHDRICKLVYDRIKDGWDSGVGPKLGKLRSKRYGDEIDINEPFPWVKG